MSVYIRRQLQTDVPWRSIIVVRMLVSTFFFILPCTSCIRTGTVICCLLAFWFKGSGLNLTVCKQPVCKTCTISWSKLHRVCSSVVVFETWCLEYDVHNPEVQSRISFVLLQGYQWQKNEEAREAKAFCPYRTWSSRITWWCKLGLQSLSAGWIAIGIHRRQAETTDFTMNPKNRYSFRIRERRRWGRKC